MVTTTFARSWISHEVSANSRAGFWRRAAALVVDFLVIGLLFQVIAIFAYDLSGGRLQSSGLVGTISHADCQMLSTLPPGIEVPAAFQANYAAECLVSVFGRPIGHLVTVGRHVENGAVTTDVSVAFQLDEQRALVRWPLLDLFILPAVILWRLLLDRGKGSLGRRMFGVRLLDADATEAKSASAGALARRYGAFALVFAPIWLVLLYQGFNPGFAFLGGMLPVLIGAAALSGLLVVVAAVAMVRRKDAFYDQFAGTRVVPAYVVDPKKWVDSNRELSLKVDRSGISWRWIREKGPATGAPAEPEPRPLTVETETP